MAVTYLNGKFTAQRTTGVQRVAACLVNALDAQLGAAGGRWVLLCPIGAAVPHLERIEVRHIGLARMPLHVWEQAVLPAAARGGLLVNLAGSAPFFAQRQVAMLHERGRARSPEAYTRAFVWWYRCLFRRLARRALGLLTVSAFSRERLATWLAVDPAASPSSPTGAITWTPSRLIPKC